MNVVLLAMCLFPILGRFVGPRWLIHLADDNFIIFTALSSSAITLRSSLIFDTTPLAVTVVSSSRRISRLFTSMIL